MRAMRQGSPRKSEKTKSDLMPVPCRVRTLLRKLSAINWRCGAESGGQPGCTNFRERLNYLHLPEIQCPFIAGLPISCQFRAQSGAFWRISRPRHQPRKKPQPLYLQGLRTKNAGGGGGNAVSGLPDETPTAKRRLA